MKTKSDLILQGEGIWCRLMVTRNEIFSPEMQLTHTEYCFTITASHLPQELKVVTPFAIVMSMKYMSLIDAVSHGTFTLELIDDIIDDLVQNRTSDYKDFTYARAEINLRYLDVLEREVSKRRGCGIPDPLLPGSDKPMKTRRNFWSKNQARIYGNYRPEWADSVWPEHSGFPSIATNMGSS